MLPKSSVFQSDRGAALLGVLVIVVVMGLLSGLAGTTWKTIVQKAREEELLWRGDQYRRDIESYVSKSQRGQGAQADPATGVTPYPNSLEELLRDTRFQHTVRHIRQLYPDPMTGEDWVLIKDPGGRIKGVRSSSALEPFKKNGFDEPYDTFRYTGSYRDWAFVFEPGRSPARSGQVGSIRGLPSGSVKDLAK